MAMSMQHTAQGMKPFSIDNALAQDNVPLAEQPTAHLPSDELPSIKGAPWITAQLN